ncbi:MAG: hypothetical protein AB7J46_06365 [Candidatus Altimarinota bacterium]
MADDYSLFRRYGNNRAFATQLDFTTATETTELVAARSASWTIYVQRIIVWIKTDAAQSLTFQDDAGTPVVIAKVPASPGADTRRDFDFGPRGVALTEGKNLDAAFSAAGLAGHLEVIGYHKE